MQTSFILSSPDVTGLPDLKLNELAIVGRSNVGKSTLLNAIAGAKIARVSKTPGRTQLINLFEVWSKSGRFALADLPGYGFADVPKALRAEWKRMIREYLLGRVPLVAVLLLIDVRRGVEDDDRGALEALHNALADRGEVVVVVTKIDKLPKAKQKPALHAIAADLELPREALLGVSAQSRLGLEPLMDRIWSLALRQKSLDAGETLMRRSKR